MTKDSAVSDFIPSLIAGTINGIIFVVSAMALAALIFTGPLSPYLSQGIGILLVGSVIFALFSAITATYPLILIAPQDIPIAILALMAASLGAGISGQMTAEEAYQFIFVAIGNFCAIYFFWFVCMLRNYSVNMRIYTLFFFCCIISDGQSCKSFFTSKLSINHFYPFEIFYETIIQ